MKKYIALLTNSGLYTLVTAKQEISSVCYMLNGKKVFKRLIVDEDDNEIMLEPERDNYKEFDDLEECQNFIAFANYH